MVEKDFPPLPDLGQLKIINTYQLQFSSFFDSLEKETSDFGTGIAVFFGIHKLANNPETPRDIKEELVAQLSSNRDNSLKSIVFCDLAKVFCFLSRLSLKRIFFFFFQQSIMKLTLSIDQIGWA